MALSMKQKYNLLDLSKLPDNLASEFKGMKENTDNFDPEMVPIEEENFNLAYGIVEKKYPEAIKGKKSIKKAAPKKVIKARVEKSTKIEWDLFIKKDGEWSVVNKNPMPMAEADAMQNDFEKSGIKYQVLESEMVGTKRHSVLKDRTKAKKKTIKPKVKKVVTEKKPKKTPPSITAPAIKIDKVTECKKIFQDAGYTVKKRIVKGKKVTKRVKRQDNTIIKEDVSKAITTVAKDTVKTRESRSEYSDSFKVLNSIKKLLTNILQGIDKLYNDNETDKLKKIESMLKNIS